jgi:hypothetical protein
VKGGERLGGWHFKFHQGGTGLTFSLARVEMTLAEEKVQSVLSRRVGSSLSCSMPLLGVVLSRHYFYFLVIVLIRKHHSPAATKAGFHFLVIYTAWILLQTERHGLLKLITDKRVLPQTIFRTFSLSSPRSSLI